MAIMSSKRKVFICASYEHSKLLEPVFLAIKEVLSELNLTPNVFVLNQEVFDSNSALMNEALTEISGSLFVIAEVSYKKIGIGIELGYAYAHKKPIIYIRKAGTAVSTTVSGISSAEVVYSTLSELKKSLTTAIDGMSGE